MAGWSVDFFIESSNLSLIQEVADLGGRSPTPFVKIFWIFPSKNKRKMNLYYLEWTLKVFFADHSPSLRKKVPRPLPKS
jgi:hypothetical protein